MSDVPREVLHWFSPAQRRLIALALSALAAVAIVWVGFKAIEMLRVGVGAFGQVIWPLAIAAILAMLLRPVVNYCEQKFKLGRVQAILALYILVAIVGLGLAALLVPFLVNQMIELAQTLPDFAGRAFHYINEQVSKYPGVYENIKGYWNEKQILQYAENLATDVKSLLSSLPAALLAASATLKRFFEFAAALAVIPIYLFFLLETDRNFMRDIKEQLSFLSAPYRQDVVFLAGEFANIMASFFQGQLLIGLILGILKAIGFTIIGVQGGFVLGMIFGLLNIVPYLGTILGLAVILPIAYFQADGGFILLLEAIGVFLAVQLCEAYYITPKIMGDRTGLHPMIIILSIFFWGAALHGILGMILAVPLTAFLVVVWRLVKAKYLPHHQGKAERGA